MPKWSKPDEALPENLFVGDRILGVVSERNPKTLKVERRLILLESTEDGWRSPDETYAGYSIHDCEYWSAEKDVLMFAKILEQ